MERYYTVKLVGADVSVARRIPLETAYVGHLENEAGGRDALLVLCLAARNDSGAKERLRTAGAAADAAVRRESVLPANARFSLSVSTLEDL